MIQPQGFDVVVFLVENPPAETARKLLERDLKRELQIRTAERRAEKRPQALRTKHVQWCFASVKMKGTQQAGNAVEMIPVKMSDENGMNAASFHSGPHELKLGAFATVK